MPSVYRLPLALRCTPLLTHRLSFGARREFAPIRSDAHHRRAPVAPDRFVRPPDTIFALRLFGTSASPAVELTTQPTLILILI